MSYLIPNPANAPTLISGQTVITSVSGIALNVSGNLVAVSGTVTTLSGSVAGVCIANSIGSSTFADVNSSVSADNLSTGSDALVTQALAYGLDDVSGVWARLRAIAVSSGMGIQSGLVMPLSGYFLGSVSILTDVGGRIVNAGNPNDDDTNPNEGALDTRSFTYGYTDHTSGWARIRALAVSSGQNQGSGLRMPFSGYFLGAASQIIDMAGTVVNVTPASDDDIEGVNLGMLDTMAKNYAYYDQQSGWARLRAIAVSSGMSGIGVPAQMPFSGYFLGTVSLIMDDDGVICDVQNSLSFTENATTSFLNTAATNYGRTPLSGELGAMQVTASGQGVSGIFHRAVVAFSGDIVQIGEGGNIVDVGTSMSDNMSNSDNELVVRPYTAGYRRDVDLWVRIDAVPYSGVTTAGSGSQALAVALVAHDFSQDDWRKISNDSTESWGQALLVDTVPSAFNIDTARVTITNLSGGTVLSSTSVKDKLIIQNESGNGVMNIGGNNAGDFPNATLGYQLYGGESLELRVTNADVVAIWAATSGQRVRTFVAN